MALVLIFRFRGDCLRYAALDRKLRSLRRWCSRQRGEWEVGGRLSVAAVTLGGTTPVSLVLRKTSVYFVSLRVADMFITPLLKLITNKVNKSSCHLFVYLVITGKI